jgi:hypothetical protein
MDHIGMEHPHCGTEEEVVAAGSNSPGTGSRIRKALGRPAGTGDSDYTVSFDPYPAASPAGPPADDGRSSCRLWESAPGQPRPQAGLELRDVAYTTETGLP